MRPVSSSGLRVRPVISHALPRLLAVVVMLGALAACETKTPSGPTALPTTTTTIATTTTTIGPTTTSSSTTTSIVLASLARRYVAFNPPPNQPSEMTLFFELLSGGAGTPLVAGVPFGGPQTAQETENRYSVRGVYAMQNGTIGNVTGTLGGSSNPLETGGTFSGTFTATTPSGCTAERPFAGRVNPQTLQLGGTDPGTSSCSPSPLSFPSFEMLRSDPAAPLPTPPAPTTSTTTTTVSCESTLSPPSTTIDWRGGAQQVGIAINAGCSWATHSFAPWITLRAPFGGNGPATVTFDVAPTTAARTGTLLIAGREYVVTQTAQFVDLVPSVPTPGGVCTYVSNRETYTITATVANQGTAPSPDTFTRFSFIFPPSQSNGGSPIVDVSTPGIGAGGTAQVTADVPWACFNFVDKVSRCDFSVTSDQNNQIVESNETNNGPVPGWCIQEPGNGSTG